MRPSSRVVSLARVHYDRNLLRNPTSGTLGVPYYGIYYHYDYYCTVRQGFSTTSASPIKRPKINRSSFFPIIILLTPETFVECSCQSQKKGHADDCRCPMIVATHVAYDRLMRNRSRFYQHKKAHGQEVC